MKQTTKVLLPLGLFISIAIPVAVKGLFTDTDFFESNESSKIDYLQPYKSRPEIAMDLPQLNTTEEGALEVIQPTTSKDTYHKPRELRSEAGGRESRKRKLNMPSSLTPSTGQEPAIELSVGR